MRTSVAYRRKSRKSKDENKTLNVGVSSSVFIHISGSFHMTLTKFETCSLKNRVSFVQ